MEWAAAAAFKNIEQQNRGVQAMLNQQGGVIYPPGVSSGVNSGHDHDHAEANPYSPLGSPNAQQLSAMRSGDGQDACLIAQNGPVKVDRADSWVQGASQYNCDAGRERSQATIADILEHCGNQDFGSVIRDSWESEKLHEALNGMAEGLELGAATVASAVAEVISAVGEIDPP